MGNLLGPDLGRSSSSQMKIGFNGKICRSGDKDYCATCETKILPGKKTAHIAGEKTWLKLCNKCLEMMYMYISGIH